MLPKKNPDLYDFYVENLDIIKHSVLSNIVGIYYKIIVEHTLSTCSHDKYFNKLLFNKFTFLF